MDSTWRRGQEGSISFSRSTPVIILYPDSKKPPSRNFSREHISPTHGALLWPCPPPHRPSAGVTSISCVLICSGSLTPEAPGEAQCWPVCWWPGLGREPRRPLELVRGHQLEFGSTESAHKPLNPPLGGSLPPATDHHSNLSVTFRLVWVSGFASQPWWRESMVWSDSPAWEKKLLQKVRQAHSTRGSHSLSGSWSSPVPWAEILGVLARTLFWIPVSLDSCFFHMFP